MTTVASMVVHSVANLAENSVEYSAALTAGSMVANWVALTAATRAELSVGC